MATIKELEELYKKAIKEVRDIEKEMRAKSFKNLSKYSQNLVKEDYEKAVSKQFDVIEQMTDLVMKDTASQQQIENIIKTA